MTWWSKLAEIPPNSNHENALTTHMGVIIHHKVLYSSQPSMHNVDKHHTAHNGRSNNNIPEKYAHPCH